LKAFILIAILFILPSCSGGKKNLFMPDSSRWTDQDIPLEELDTGNINTDSVNTADKMKALFSPGDSLIEGRPVSFYLYRGDVSPVAKDFYLLRFIPSDNPLTFSLGDSLLTRNDTTRPFYYFLFRRLRQISDEALTEGLTNYAARYALTYPEEFFKKLRMPVYRASYSDWVLDFASSIPSLKIVKEREADDVEAEKYIVEAQLNNSRKPTKELRNTINKFAKDVAEQYKKNW
jgi:hypothetical protein